MKKYILQIIGLLLSVISYLYFVLFIDNNIWLDKTEYDRFYLDTLQKPFMIINGLFIGMFILSFFFKKYTKWLIILFVICLIALYFTNNYYWNILNHGQGG